MIVGGNVYFNIYPASAESPVISWGIDPPYIASLSLTQPDLTKTASVIGNSPGEAHIEAFTGCRSPQWCATPDAVPPCPQATVKVLDMNGTWHSQEWSESSTCPTITLEAADWVVTQTGNQLHRYAGAFYFSGGITGRQYTYGLDWPAYISPGVLMEWVYESGTVSNDGMSYNGTLSWRASYYDENGEYQYCTGTSGVYGFRTSAP